MRAFVWALRRVKNVDVGIQNFVVKLHTSSTWRPLGPSAVNGCSSVVVRDGDVARGEGQ